jgi:hypothetical protein
MIKITILEDIDNNEMTAWTFEIEEDDYWNICRKYGADGYSTRGTKEEVFEELKG